MKPKRKINAVLLSGALLTILTWAANQAGHAFPPDIQSALQTVIMGGMGYFISDAG